MITQQTSGTEPAPMIHPFPQPGKLVRHAYYELHTAVNGTPEHQKHLGNHALLPRPWDPASCGDPGLRHQLWQWLDAVVIWLNHDYTWDAQQSGMIPVCWPQHPHLVHEIAVLADQRRRAGLAKTSDALEEWHRYCLPSFTDRVRARLRSHCEDGHTPWPARPRHNEHTSQAQTRRREAAFADDVNALPERRRALPSQPTDQRTGPRLGVVDLETGELRDPDEHFPRTRTPKGPRT